MARFILLNMCCRCCDYRSFIHKNVRGEKDIPYYKEQQAKMAVAEGEKPKLTLADFGGAKFLLVIFTYITQGMLF